MIEGIVALIIIHLIAGAGLETYRLHINKKTLKEFNELFVFTWAWWTIKCIIKDISE